MTLRSAVDKTPNGSPVYNPTRGDQKTAALPTLPSGHAFVTDDNGNYLINDNGDYVIAESV